MKVHEAIADATIDEGVDTVFAVMGDGNMHMLMRLRERGVRVCYARHEGGAIAMAEGYARATGRLGVCSVTCGPGLTLTATALVIASRARTPLVVLAGDHPRDDPFYNQALDQRRFVEACEAHPVRLDNHAGFARELAQAFFLAAARGPVVVSTPFDFADTELPDDYAYAGLRGRFVRGQAVRPAPQQVEEAAAAIAAAERPLVLVGQGGVHAAELVEELAEELDAGLATSMMALGLFAGNPRDVGVAGGFARDPARAFFAERDCVIAVGASLNQYTTAYGRLFGDATIVQIDSEPQNLIHARRGPLNAPLGPRAPDHYVQGDAAATVEALLAALRRDGVPARGEPFEAPPEPDPAAEEPPAERPDGHNVDPRAAMRAVAAGASPDALFVIGLGHYWWFAATFLRGRRYGSYQLTTEFGSIGQGLPSAIGTALGRPDRDVVLVEGDGSLMMSLSELDTAVRAGVRVLVIVMNDHGLGAEAHKLAARGHDPDDARIPPPDFTALCRTLGGRAARVESIHELEAALRELGPLDGLRLIDVALTPDMMSEPYARALAAEAVG